MSVRAPDKVLGGGEGGTLYVFANFNINELNSAFVVPCGYSGGRYTVGTIQVVSRTGTFATAQITPLASNEPEIALVPTAHPDAIPIIASGTATPGLALDYWWFGGYVSTIEGSAATADVYVVLSP